MNKLARLSLAAAAVSLLAARAGAIDRAMGPRSSVPPAGPAMKAPGSITQASLPGAANIRTGLPGAMPAAALPQAEVPRADVQAAAPGDQPAAFGSLTNMGDASASFGNGAQASVYQGYSLGMNQFDGAAVASSYRYPTYTEQAKIDESLARANDRGTYSAMAVDLIREFRNKGGQFAIDPDQRAAYHGTAFRDQNNRPTIALTADTINNGSWAFILATVSRELLNFNDWYNVVPASAERLAIQYAHMAMVFAEATRSNMTAWSTNLDHNHANEGTYFVWAWYEQLQKAMTSTTVGFANSEYFTWLRDYVAKQVAANPAYQYSLYERLTGKHYRPNDPLHDRPIPSNVPRLNQAEHDKAQDRFYGADGNGDNGNGNNMLGFLKSWFGRRGNI